MHDHVPLAGVKVAYLFIHDANYPRNRLIREHLGKAGAQVDIFPVDSIGVHNPLAPAYIRKLVAILVNYDLAVVSEFQLRYALAVGVAAKLARTRLVVDGFVGRYETAVGDWGQVSNFSLKSFVYRAIDASSLFVADIFVIDNEFRASQIRATNIARMFRKRITFLPVGAPPWAVPKMQTTSARPTSPLNVLYYGNYIPLHGVDVVLAGVAEYASKRPIKLVLVGNGVQRQKFEREAVRLGISDVCDFRDPVDEQDLAPIIAASEVVLGVFGESPKAKTVIANKVWQGLAMGKRVLTRDSPALHELDFINTNQLLTIRPEASQMADAFFKIASLKEDLALHDFPETHSHVQGYVDRRFREFMTLIKKEIIL